MLATQVCRSDHEIETFGTTDQTPTTNITGPNTSVIPTTTFTITGTASDDFGVNSITVSLRGPQNRYLQANGTAAATYTTFRVTPDVVGATSATMGLSPRELEVLGLLGHGLDTGAIADRLVISRKTVATHIQRILSKLGVHSRTAAVARAHREGLVPDVEAHRPVGA